jgi:polyprenyl-phospho-N-acetylgalactosaminyl synthase
MNDLPQVLSFRPCAIVPTYNNPGTIRIVIEKLKRHIPNIIVVDDGSDEEAREIIQQFVNHDTADVVLRELNGGKGAAVKSGLLRAQERDFTHALQIDADDQHNFEDIPLLLKAAQSTPRALVLAAPQFDDTAPKVRLWFRKLTLFWTNVETMGKVIEDPMCGFRVYPVNAAIATNTKSDHMDFDPEIAVRLVWRSSPIINIPTKVRYVSKEQGGVSHFRLFRDNVLITWMHTRLVIGAILRLLRIVRDK